MDVDRPAVPRIPYPGQSVNRLVTRYAHDVRVSLPVLGPPIGHAVFRPCLRAQAPQGMSWRGFRLMGGPSVATRVTSPYADPCLEPGPVPSRCPRDRDAVRQCGADYPACT